MEDAGRFEFRVQILGWDDNIGWLDCDTRDKKNEFWDHHHHDHSQQQCVLNPGHLTYNQHYVLHPPSFTAEYTPYSAAALTDIRAKFIVANDLRPVSA